MLSFIILIYRAQEEDNQEEFLAKERVDSVNSASRDNVNTAKSSHISVQKVVRFGSTKEHRVRLDAPPTHHDSQSPFQTDEEGQAEQSMHPSSHVAQELEELLRRHKEETSWLSELPAHSQSPARVQGDRNLGDLQQLLDSLRSSPMPPNKRTRSAGIISPPPHLSLLPLPSILRRPSEVRNSRTLSHSNSPSSPSLQASSNQSSPPILSPHEETKNKWAASLSQEIDWSPPSLRNLQYPGGGTLEASDLPFPGDSLTLQVVSLFFLSSCSFLQPSLVAQVPLSSPNLNSLSPPPSQVISARSQSPSNARFIPLSFSPSNSGDIDEEISLEEALGRTDEDHSRLVSPTFLSRNSQQTHTLLRLSELAFSDTPATKTPQERSAIAPRSSPPVPRKKVIPLLSRAESLRDGFALSSPSLPSEHSTESFRPLNGLNSPTKRPLSQPSPQSSPSKKLRRSLLASPLRPSHDPSSPHPVRNSIISPEFSQSSRQLTLELPIDEDENLSRNGGDMETVLPIGIVEEVITWGDLDD